jgi:serine/threonine-protein phosphatase 4 regulatory subunit 1
LVLYEQNKSPAAENEAPYYLAFNIPAVIYTYGVSAWPKIKPLYDTLSKDSRFKVRRTLAFSIHEMAKMIGPELAESDLLPILFRLMADNNDVREGIMNNLSKFIEILRPEQRETFIDKLSQNDTLDP